VDDPLPLKGPAVDQLHVFLTPPGKGGGGCFRENIGLIHQAAILVPGTNPDLEEPTPISRKLGTKTDLQEKTLISRIE
jgi:hypothetical protein